MRDWREWIPNVCSSAAVRFSRELCRKMANAWLHTLKSAQKTCLLQDGKKKIHYTFSDGSQMVEEYDARNGTLVVRKWSKKSQLGAASQWEFEVGELQLAMNLEAAGMRESATNPICVRKDTKPAFQWRIRNLPYAIDVYDVSVNADEQVIVVRTTNKKYYKKLKVPDMERAGGTYDAANLSIAHANNTLIVTYKKPTEVLNMEKLLEQEINKVKVVDEGDVSDCKQS